MDRSSRASAQSPPALSFQRVAPPDWPPRMSRASAHEQYEQWMSSSPYSSPSPDWGSRPPNRSPHASRPRATTAQGVASRPRRATDSSSPAVASRPRRATVRSRDIFDSPSPPPARRSTRKRKAPETLTPLPEPVASRTKRAAAPEKPPAKKPPADTRPPGKPKTDPDEDEKQQDCDSNCCICMTEPEPQEVAFIDGCEHSFCFGCIEKWADRENTCPLCKTRFTKIERNQKTKRGKSTVKVKEKSQRSEFTSSIALEGLFGELGRSGIAFESFFARLGGSRFVNTQVARIIVGGMELGSNGGAGSSTAASRPSTRANAARRPSSSLAPGSRVLGHGSHVRDVEDFFGRGDDDESDSEDDLGFSSFVNSMRMGASLRRTGVPSFSFSSSRLSHAMPPPPPPARNFAVNSNDATAGRSIETPLEICDSDDDDDEVVVVETRPASARRL